MFWSHDTLCFSVVLASRKLGANKFITFSIFMRFEPDYVFILTMLSTDIYLKIIYIYIYIYPTKLTSSQRMAQLPNLDKYSLQALSWLPRRLITDVPPARSIQTLMHTCREKKHTFSETWHALHCTSKLSNLNWSSFSVMSHDKWHWQTSTSVWGHPVCHLRCSMLTSREIILVQMQIISEYIFLYENLLNCFWHPDWSTTLKTPCNNPPVTPTYENLFVIGYCFWIYVVDVNSRFIIVNKHVCLPSLGPPLYTFRYKQDRYS